MNYSAPSDQIVYDDVPGDIDKLLKTGRYTDDSANVTRVELTENPSDHFFDVYSPGQLHDAVLFVAGERQNGKGERRLVIVKVVQGFFSMSD